MSSEMAERRYVEAIFECYRSLPGTATVTSRHDRKCARALFRRGVPLDVVEGAMVVAVARRTLRRGDPLPRVRALHFFLPVIDELLETPFDPGYVGYLKQKLLALTAQKVHHEHTDVAERSAEQVDESGRGSPHPLREAPSSRGR